MSKRVMVNLAVGLATILLAGIGWQWLRDRAALVESSRWETHTYVVMQQLEGLLSDLRDVETGQRGFLITGSDSYLEPYHEALGRVDQTLASLRDLTQDNPRQQQRLAALETVIHAKLAELKETIDLRAGQGFEPARAIVLTGRGKALMDQARQQVAEAQAEERQFLQERATAKQTNLRRTFQIVTIGGVFSYLLFLTAFLLLRREIGQRLGVEQELRRHRDHLEDLVKGRTAELQEANEQLAASNEELRVTTNELQSEIEDRKKAEAALRESEERFRAAYEQAAIGIEMLDLEGRFLRGNGWLNRMLGYREDELQRRTFAQITHPDDLQKELPILGRLLAGEVPNYSFEKRYLHKDGHAVWVCVTSSLVRTSAPYRISIIEDITEQKKAQEERERLHHELSVHAAQLQEANERLAALNEELAAGNEELRATTEELQSEIEDRTKAEQALRESEERFRVAQELSPDGFLIFRPLRDPAGVVTDFLWIYENDAAARMNDTNPKKVLGKRVSEALPHHDQSPFHQAYKEVAETGEIRVVEEASYDQDTFRQRRWFRAAAVPTTGGDVAVLVQDVTERKTAAEELQRQRQIFETTVNEIATGVSLYRGADFVVVLANPAYLALASGRDVVGRPYREVWPEAYARVAPLLQRVLATGEPYQAVDESFSLRRADGQFETRYFTWSLLRVRLPGEKGWGILNSVAETTTRVRAEAALRELNTTLESKVAERTAELAYRARQLQKLTLELTQAEERERRRIAVILHEDLQQQIAGAKFHLSLVRHRAKDDRVRVEVDEVDAMLREAVEKSRRLSHDLSPAVMHMNDLAEVLRWLVNRVQTQQGLSVSLAVSGDMMLQSEALGAFLFRSAQEMLLNVIKHAHVREAAIRVKRVGCWVGLCVSDRGRGFDPRELRETPGVGLFSIRERTELLGGRMRIKSVQGQGSRFSIMVPDGQKPDVRGQITDDGGQTTEDRGRKADRDAVVRNPSSVVRVLLVDDHDIVRQGLAALLQEAPGVELVGEAPDGREAINRALELQPDVVIMDVSMPLLSGDQATRQIKAYLPETRVIALSMYEDADKKQSMFEAGAEDYILKTISADDLIAAIRGRSADEN